MTMYLQWRAGRYASSSVALHAAVPLPRTVTLHALRAQLSPLPGRESHRSVAASRRSAALMSSQLAHRVALVNGPAFVPTQLPVFSRPFDAAHRCAPASSLRSYCHLHRDCPRLPLSSLGAALHASSRFSSAASGGRSSGDAHNSQQPAPPPPHPAAVNLFKALGPSPAAAVSPPVTSDVSASKPTPSTVAEPSVELSQPPAGRAVSDPPPTSSPAPPQPSASVDAQLLAAALAPSMPSPAPKPTASPPPLHSDSSPPPPAAYLSIPFAPMPAAAAAVPSPPDPLEAFASQQSDQPTVDSTKDPTAPLNIPAMPDLPPSRPNHPVPAPAPAATPASAQAEATKTAAAGSAVAEIGTVSVEGRRGSSAVASPAPSAVPSSAADTDTPATPQTAASSSAPSSSQPPSLSSTLTSTPPASTHSVQQREAVSAVADLSSASLTGSSSTSGGASGVTSSVGSGEVSSAIQTTIPSFLRPAELSLWSRIKLHPLFKHWPNVGYLISAVSVLVSDILWLRSLLILANCFGILVNRSFNFWTGIYWSARSAAWDRPATPRIFSPTPSHRSSNEPLSSAHVCRWRAGISFSFSPT